MTCRSAWSVVSLLMVSAFAEGCTDACDEYTTAFEDKLTECGIEIPEPPEDAEEVPEPACTDAQWVQAECLEACIPESCGALDGTDSKGASAFSECKSKCPQGGL